MLTWVPVPVQSSRPWKPRRTPLPGWANRVTSFLLGRMLARTTIERARVVIPHQWFTADGRPRCVCCGDLLNRRGDGLLLLEGLGLRALGVCVEHCGDVVAVANESFAEVVS